MKKISLLFLVLIPLVAVADDFPTRKPGLWLLQTEGMAGRPAQSVKQCIDAESDAAMMKTATGMAGSMGAKCAKMEFRKEGAGYVNETDCTFSGMHIVSKTDFAGDFNSAYSSTTTSHFDPPMMGRSGDTRKTTAKWLGECEPGQQPGDIIMSNGMKMNMNSLGKFGSMGGGMGSGAGAAPAGGQGK